MEAFGRALGARQVSDFNDLWAGAESDLATVFKAPEWGVVGRAEPYTESNARNLWANELNDSVRAALEENGVGQQSFRDWLGGIHYVYVAAYLESLFDRYQDNKGWRILAISIPAAGVAAVGIASHYQQGQRHNRLGEVSNLLREQAEGGLADQGIELPGRKIEPADWDGTGLMRSPLDEIAGVKLPSGQAGRLKYVRSTTVKKVLASFIDVYPLALSSPGLGQDLKEVMEGLENAGRGLA